MESQVEDFVKTFCEGETCSTTYIAEKKKAASKITNSEPFQKELMKYQALSNKKRFLIYSLIKQGEVCNCVLAKILDLSPGSITHHIKKLEKAGLIVGRNQGHFTIYYTAEQLKKEL